MTRIYTVTAVDFIDGVNEVMPFAFAYRTMKAARAAVTASFQELTESFDEPATLRFEPRYNGDTGCVGRYDDGDYRTEWQIEVVELVD